MPSHSKTSVAIQLLEIPAIIPLSGQEAELVEPLLDL